MIEALREAGYWLTKRKTLAERRATELRAKWKDPAEPRHWHNPADPVQAARIKAAAAKRARKAETRQFQAHRSYSLNGAHTCWANSYNTLHPFYLAK